MALRANENKVKFGLKRVAFAIATIAPDGSATYDTPITFPGARALSMEPQGTGEAWYSDDGVYYYNTAPSARQGDLEMARMIDSFKEHVLGYVQDTNGLMLDDMYPETVHFALLFETMNDKRPRRYVMYNCVATASTVGSNTNEGSKEPQTETTTINSMGIYVASHGKWFDHAETTPRTDPEAYANWFNAVQLPAPPADPYPIKTKSGPVVVITDGAEDMAVTSLVVDIASTAGVTGATIKRLGRNLLEPFSYSARGITTEPQSDGTMRAHGTATSAGNVIAYKNVSIADIGFAVGDTFTLSCGADVQFTVRFLDSEGQELSRTGVAVNGVPVTGTIPASTAQLRFVSQFGTVAIGDVVDITSWFQIERGRAFTSFKPWQGESYDLTFPSGAGTVTAGTLDVTNGVLTVGSQTYGMTPVEITTLHGDNIIFADCGSVTVQYHSDPDLDFE